MDMTNHTRLDLVEGGSIFKQGEHAQLAFNPRDYSGKTVDLTGKDIAVAIWNSKGVMYEGTASFDSTAQLIRLTINQLLQHGDFQIEFTVTDAADPDYRRKFPSGEYEGKIYIKPSADNIDFIGVSMTTVAQLRTEQEEKQQQFELAIVPQVDELKQRVEEGIGAFTEDTEVKDARMDEINLRTFNQKVVAQLAETARLEDLVYKRDKTIPIGMTDLATDIKTALVGGAVNIPVTGEYSVGRENIKVGSVPASRLSNMTSGKNLFDKSATKIKTTLNSSTGLPQFNETEQISDYMLVEPNTAYVNSVIRPVVFYDASLAIISVIAGQKSYTSPANAVFMRVSLTDAQANTLQVEKGTVSTPYQEYTPFARGIKPDVSKVDPGSFTGELIKNRAITKEHLNFLESGKNKFNKSAAIKDTTVIGGTGETAYFKDVFASEFIPVIAGEKYTFSNERYAVYYDVDKKYISVQLNAKTITIPENAVYMRTSIPLNLINTFQIEKGTVKTAFESFRMYSKGIALDPESNTLSQKMFDVFTKDDKQIKDKKDISLFGHAVCHIPTYDNTLSICHPSVVEHPTMWNGYKYWMGMTPYPQSPEEPSIVASHDGINWEEPKGIVNPLFTKQDSIDMGYSLTSDTHLLFSADKTKLLLYFRSMYEKGEGIHLLESTNGINWTLTPEVIFIPFTLASNGTTKEYISIMSPAVEFEANGTFTMWSINSRNANANVVEKRTSVDGKTWSAPSNCIVPNAAGFTGYHLDVKRSGNNYYMFLLGSPGGLRMRFLTSTDGVNWQYTTNKNFPLSGFDWDKNAHYRSAFLPKANGKFDVWLNGIKYGTGNAWANDAQWRVAYYPDADLTNMVIKTAKKVSTYYGTVDDAPTSVAGYVNGDRYEYTNPSNYVGRIVVNGVWREFGMIS